MAAGKLNQMISFEMYKGTPLQHQAFVTWTDIKCNNIFNYFGYHWLLLFENGATFIGARWRCQMLKTPIFRNHRAKILFSFISMKRSVKEPVIFITVKQKDYRKTKRKPFSDVKTAKIPIENCWNLKVSEKWLASSPTLTTDQHFKLWDINKFNKHHLCGG